MTSLGYGNEAVVEAIAAQLRRLSYTMPFRLTNDRALELAAAMNEVSAGAIDRAMFYTGGSEAVEAALKLARNYHYLNGRTERELTVTRVHSYHGNTFAALSASGVRQRREPYTPLLAEGPRVAMPLDGNPPDPVAETGPNVYGRGVAEDLRELDRGRRAGAHLGVRHGARGRRRRAGACARAWVLRGRPRDLR